ncbi:MAG: hypothetical protein ACFB9M_06320 [Myxococcota bacterium]
MRGSRWIVVWWVATAPGLSFAQVGAPSGTDTSTASSPATRSSPEADGSIERLQQEIDLITSEIENANLEVDLLKDTALSGEVGRTHGVIMHQNALGAGFRLERIQYVLDGKTLLDKRTEEFDLRRNKLLPIYTGFMSPGEHLVEVEAAVRSGTYGLFTYVEGYEFSVRSRYILKIREGRQNRLDVVFFQKDDISLPVQERLQIRYDLEVKAGLPLPPEDGGPAQTPTRIRSQLTEAP